MIPRSATPTLQRLAKGFPVVVLTGPRQSGKTTLAKAVFNLKTAVGHVRMGRHGDVLGRRDNAAGYCPQGGATPPARPRMAQSGV